MDGEIDPCSDSARGCRVLALPGTLRSVASSPTIGTASRRCRSRRDRPGGRLGRGSWPCATREKRGIAMQPFKPRQCTEREPGGYEDCTWCSGVMLANAGFGANIAPSTRTEYESLRVAGGDGPAENPGDGSNLGQLLVGMQRQYSWAPSGSSAHSDWIDVRERLEDVGDCAVLQGSMGVFAKDSHWRRWDAQFDGAHAVFVERIDGDDHLWWMNPQAPNKYQGEFISLADARRYYEGLDGGALYTRVGKVRTSK